MVLISICFFFSFQYFTTTKEFLGVWCLLKIFLGLYIEAVNLLTPTGYVTYHQFNIQQLYALPTLYLCVLYLSENKQRLVPLSA